MLASGVQLMPDKTLLAQMAIFLVVLVALHHLIFKPVLRLIQLRRQRTQGDSQKIQELTETTDSLVKEYEGKIQGARKEAFQMKEAIRREGEAQGQKIIQEARMAGLAQVEKIRQEIQKETEQAGRKLEAEAKILSHSLTEKLLGRPLERVEKN